MKKFIAQCERIKCWVCGYEFNVGEWLLLDDNNQAYCIGCGEDENNG